MILRLLIVSALFASAALAELRTFPENNFSLETPQWWMPITPPPAQATIAMRSPKRDRAIYVLTARNPPTPPTAEQLKESARQGLTDQGLTIAEEREVPSNGLTFLTFVGRSAEGASAALWILMASDQIYSMRADFALGDVVTDADIQGALHSFRLLKMPGTTVAVQPPPITDATRLPLFALGALFALGVAVLLALRFAGEKKK